VTGAQVRDAFGGLIGDADKAVIEGAFADEMAVTMRKGLAVSFDGWIDDDIAFIQPWGFNLAEISKPVKIWQGDQDLMVPHAHSYWLEKHIPGATLNFVPGHGHISLITEYRTQILAQAEELLK
jgi:pimeloyl-ACP methyl ester carboxylesterase